MQKPENMSVNPYLSCMKVSLLLICMLFFQLSRAQYNFGEVDQKLEAAKKALGGNAVAQVYKDGKIIYQKEMGEFTGKTQARIASCSKWLTAAIVISFVDEGKI